MENFEDNCSLLVSSCDAYSDLWIPFSQCLTRYWPQRKFDTYIICESNKADINGVKFLNSGHIDADWSII